MPTPLMDAIKIPLQHSAYSMPIVMGVINRSVDSFFSPAQSLSAAIDQAAEMVAAGARILDIGGEATNPSVKLKAGPSLQAELDLVIPTIEALQKRFDVCLSVDTSKPTVMQASLEQGATMINDQRALTAEGALAVVAKFDALVCLMHFPEGRQPASSSAAELMNQVGKDLLGHAMRCQEAGIAAENIILDPGFGQGNYGKNCDENYYLLAHLHELVTMGYPVLIGWSRKSMIGDVLDSAAPAERLHGSVAAALFAAHQGARMIRVHDVKATVEALTIWFHALQYTKEMQT